MSRYDKLDVNEVASRNRNVDLGKVQEIEKTIRKLHAVGVSSQGFDLLPPFRRQAHSSSTPTRMSRDRLK